MLQPRYRYGLDSSAVDHRPAAEEVEPAEVQGYAGYDSSRGQGETVSELVARNIGFLNGYWTALQNCGHRQF
jgi:hypothetical protein